MFTQISWDTSGCHMVVILDHPVPENDDVEEVLCSYHGIEGVRLHSDRSIVELVIAHASRRLCAEVAALHLFARGYVRPALWFGEPLPVRR